MVPPNMLTTLHFTNVCEQAMEIEMATCHSHTWLQTVFIAVFAFHPTVVYHQVWITFVAVLVQIALIVHMQVGCDMANVTTSINTLLQASGQGGNLCL